MDVSTFLSLLHDAQLTAVELAGKDAKVSFRLTDGPVRSILLAGVDRLFCNDFLEGNIVLDARMISSPKITKDDVEYFVSMHPVLSDPVAYLEHIRSSQKGMLLIESSYGAEFGCVCIDVSVA